MAKISRFVFNPLPFKLLLSLLWLMILLAGGGCDGSPTASTEAAAKPATNTVRVVAVPGGFRLERQSKPYRIRGAGSTQYFDCIREAGGNSVRLWSADYAGTLLEEARRQGLTVMLGLWLEPDGKGVDYYDRTAVQAQLRRLRSQVLQFRHHPALLMWNVGNELDLGSLNPQMFRAINEVAVMIHELDPDHPVTTSVVMLANAVPAIQRWVPAIDILAINAYAPLLDLPEAVRKSGWTGPYVVTEFGARGYWESKLTSWNAPLEQSSATKASFVAERYRRTVVADSARCLGSYVFFWGRKFEQTSTWFSLFTPANEKTLLVDTMAQLWGGARPSNLAPSITSLKLAGHQDPNPPRLRPNTDYLASFTATDPEGQPLTVTWELKSDVPLEQALNEGEAGEALTGYIRQGPEQSITLRTPYKPGAYRLYLVLHDGRGGAATANIPFYCKPGGPVRLAK